MSDPMKQAWRDVEERFSTLGSMMKEHYQGETDDAAAPSAERSNAVRDALEQLVVAGRQLGERTADVIRDDDVKDQAKRAAASLNAALSATVDLIGDQIAGLFKRPEVEEASSEEHLRLAAALGRRPAVTGFDL